FTAVISAIEHDMDIFVTGLPGIVEERRGTILESRRNRVTQPIERLAQRRPPFLIPFRMPAGIASAMTVPPFDALRTAPGAAFPNFGLHHRRMLRKVLAVVGEPGKIVVPDVMESIGERHLPFFVVMAVRFTVRGDVYDLGPGSALFRKRRNQTCCKVVASVEQVFESDALGNRTI